MDISIIIVNWNSAAYTEACVSSIRQSVHNHKYELIIVDNGSTDGSLEKLKQIPDIRLLVSSTNIGFARANNMAYAHSSGNHLLFLNPDTVVYPGAIERMEDALRSDEKLAIVGCKLLNSDLSLQTSCVQAFPTIANQFCDVEVVKIRFPTARMWGIDVLFREQTGPVPVEVVSGACLMIRRDVFARVGGFCIDYFMYCEDVDLCYKVAKAGFRVGYASNATVVHYGGQSSKQASDSSFSDVVNRDAILIFLTKTRGWIYANAYRCAVCLAALARLLALRFLPLGLLGEGYEDVSRARRKWTRLLRWSLGREQWVRHLGSGVERKPIPAA